MHYRKIFAPAVLSALLVCLFLSGCSIPEERRDALDNIEWDATSVEPEYLTEWPDNAFTEKISQPESGTIAYVLDYTETGRYTIFIKDISPEESDRYVKALKDNGYFEIHSAANNVSLGTIPKREDTYLNILHSDGVLGIVIFLKSITNQAEPYFSACTNNKL